jgi:hypothetical protein
MDANSPIYGLMSLVALSLGGWYAHLAADTAHLTDSLRLFGRLITAGPVLLLLLVVAWIRKPWKHH